MGKIKPMHLHPQAHGLLHHFDVKLHQFTINYDTSAFLVKVRNPLKALDPLAFQEVRKSSIYYAPKYLNLLILASISSNVIAPKI